MDLLTKRTVVMLIQNYLKAESRGQFFINNGVTLELILNPLFKKKCI